ncbi:MAG: 4-keto-6-deoxy-N-Acetyl-D-hexosaminyl-(Lipid carrier) aminotransferase [Microgenomates group bacterium GW2011_GWC1_39_12]|nr:MAG: 4-keto-6-deoxy-N-Acetyl-D-hexosaminyl-(Lipid carrier) aminotransferase [Microgenomates group bacterium GW2011_GWC1_39_12]
MKISLHKPYWGKEESRIVADSLKKSNGVGDGLYTKRLDDVIKRLTHSSYVFAVPSCTHGLELACRVMGIGIGDEVIVPGFTLSSSANCVVLTGARPVFADIEENTYCIDPKSIIQLISKKTKGIIVVHYAGMPCRMEEIQSIAKQHKLFIIEDAAHCIGAYYKGKMLGTIGDVGVYSFHGTKNICSGEGGMVVTNNKKLVEKMDIFRANGTNRSAFLDHRVALYTWVGLGSSYLLSDLLAALLIAQLKKLIIITKKRTAIAHRYTKSFLSYPGVHVPTVPRGALPNWHIYAIRFDKPTIAKQFTQYMNEHNISAVRHYVPIHTSPMGRELSGKLHRPLPVVERVAETLVRLPIYPGLSKKQIERVIKVSTKAFALFI